MQVVKKALLIFFVVWFALVLFMPKRNLYYRVEQELAAQDIKINEGKISEGVFTLDIEHAVVYVKGIDLIHVEHAGFLSLLFYNSLTLKGIKLDDSLTNMMPTKLDEVRLSYAVWSPGHVSVAGKGPFGAFKGNIDLLQRKIHLDFTKSTKLGVLKRQLKKGKQGLYYETSF
ncbi:hypothetical protein MNB_SV-10-477 [hydrothermal vent metagenome]|uniref:Uncharacterized protein n=1 Tax=hydrothermal vent metagenome TaxID=652676 RepID=A0A1W1BTL0_9ZZZZ